MEGSIGVCLGMTEGLNRTKLSMDEAVRRRVLELTVQQAKERNARYDQGKLLDLIDEEVDAARASRS